MIWCYFPEHWNTKPQLSHSINYSNPAIVCVWCYDLHPPIKPHDDWVVQMALERSGHVLIASSFMQIPICIHSARASSRQTYKGQPQRTAYTQMSSVRMYGKHHHLDIVFIIIYIYESAHLITIEIWRDSGDFSAPRNVIYMYNAILLASFANQPTRCALHIWCAKSTKSNFSKKRHLRCSDSKKISVLCLFFSNCVLPRVALRNDRDVGNSTEKRYCCRANALYARTTHIGGGWWTVNINAPSGDKTPSNFTLTTSLA